MGIIDQNNHKLSVLEKCAYGAGDLACNLFWGIVCIAGMFYSDIFGLDPTEAATMMMIISYLDIVIDIFIGSAADRCNTKYGKFRPWILYGLVPFCVAGVFAFKTPDFAIGGKLVYAYITFFLFRILYAVVNVPYGALLGVLSEDTEERDSVSAYRNIGAQIGFWLSFAMVMKFAQFMKEATGASTSNAFFYVVLIYGVVALILLFCTFNFTRERVKPVKEENNSLKEDLGDLGKNRQWWCLSVAVLAMIIFTACHNSTAAYYAKYFLADIEVVEQGSKIVEISATNDNKKTPIYILENGRHDTSSVGVIKIAGEDVAIERCFEVVGADGKSVNIKASRGDGAEPQIGDNLSFFKYNIKGTCLGMQVDWELFYALFASMGTLFTILGTMLIKPIVSKFGKKNTWIGCFLLSSLISILFMVIPKDSLSVIIILNCLFTLIIGPTGFIMYSMYADVADDAEVKTGRRATGLIYTSATMAQKLGYTIANSLPLYGLGMVGFIANDVNITGDIKDSVKTIFVLIPLIGSVIGIVALIFYTIDQKKIEENTKALAQMREKSVAE
ncbi:MAG: MFS transporter [Bacteroidales bacterium]|nr:MFS transporter [Candidatus Scybalocola fimicaballi]